MCLATVYDGSRAPDRVLCRNITYIAVDGDKITLTDILGAETVYRGRIVSAELNGGTVILDKEATA